MLYGLWQLGGANLLVLTAVAAYTAAVALLMGTLRSWVGPVTAAVLASWALIVTEERFLIRPEMVSLVLLGIMLRLLLTATESSTRRLLGLPLLMLLWVNVHGGFLVAFAVLGCYVAGAVAARSRDLLAPLLTGGVAAAAAALVNPWGWRLPAHLLSFFARPRPALGGIAEFAPASVGVLNPIERVRISSACAGNGCRHAGIARGCDRRKQRGQENGAQATPGLGQWHAGILCGRCRIVAIPNPAPQAPSPTGLR